jgi:hypothetical protein
MKDPPVQSSGSAELFFDPDRFSAAVAGVARAADQIGSAQRQVDHAAGTADDFGAVGPAWSAFHQAWAARADLTTKAADQLTSLLPVAAHAIKSADAGSGTINAASIWSGGPDGTGSDFSVQTSITPIVAPVNGKK